MSNRTPAILATTITIGLLIVTAILSILLEMLALNGVSESQGVTAMGTSLICQGVGAILAGGLAFALTNLFVNKLNWNKILSVVLAVVAGTVLGVGLAFASSLFSMIVAGVR